MKIHTVPVSQAEMKEIVLIFITFSLVTVHATRDWAKILPAGETTHRELDQFASSEDRIVGGDVVVPNSIPYQAALILFYDEEDTNDAGFCGGSIITRRYVLTAAHCLVDGVVSLEVILGAHNFRQNESTQQHIPTSTFKVHEQYNAETLENDLGIVYLPTPASLNQYVQLIPLPSRADVSDSFVGSEAVASGWGYDTDSETAVNDILRFVNVSIIATDVCNVMFVNITDKLICSGGAGVKGICLGDAGGPLVVNGKLVGITSSVGYNGCEAEDPSIFSRITSYLDWISANSDAVVS